MEAQHMLIGIVAFAVALAWAFATFKSHSEELREARELGELYRKHLDEQRRLNDEQRQAIDAFIAGLSLAAALEQARKSGAPTSLYLDADSYAVLGFLQVPENVHLSHPGYQVPKIVGYQASGVEHRAVQA